MGDVGTGRRAHRVGGGAGPGQRIVGAVPGRSPVIEALSVTVAALVPLSPKGVRPMSQPAVRDGVAGAVQRAEALEAEGDVRQAIDILTRANRLDPDPQYDRALVRVRRGGCRWLTPPDVPGGRQPVVASQPGDGVFEVAAAELSVSSLREGLSQSGCVLVRGIISPDRAAHLAAGIDTALAAYDAAEAGDETVDRAWYNPFSMPDRVPAAVAGAVATTSGAHQPAPLPERKRRQFIRDDGGLWTAYSPHMLFELLEVVDDVGIGALMTEFLGERPLLSANKCTLRRAKPQAWCGGWHQDGAFLGDHVGSFNFWLSLSRCGRDAPGLDLVPRRIDQVLPSGEGAPFAWALSDEAVLQAANGTPIARPEFEAGDALLFDHRLVHRTASDAEMTRERHAIEAWFFAASAYPAGQLPLIY